MEAVEEVADRVEEKVTARPTVFVSEALQHFAYRSYRQALRHV